MNAEILNKSASAKMSNCITINFDNVTNAVSG